MTAIPILMYHSISSDAGRKFRPFTLSPELFEAHVQYMAENGYTALTVTQLMNALHQKTFALPERPVVITFDDGFHDFYDHAFPTLMKFRSTATLFIVTGYVEGTSNWLRAEGETNRKMLKWPRILELDQAGIECGAHSHTHADLDIKAPGTVRKEITFSKELLEQKLGHEVTAFCYPFGHYDHRVRDMVKHAGFRAACAVRNALSHANDNRFSLARITINNRTSIARLADLLKGKGLVLAREEEGWITRAWRDVRRLRQAFHARRLNTA